MAKDDSWQPNRSCSNFQRTFWIQTNPLLWLHRIRSFFEIYWGQNIFGSFAMVCKYTHNNNNNRLVNLIVIPKSLYPLVFLFWFFFTTFHNSCLTQKCLKFIILFINRFCDTCQDKFSQSWWFIRRALTQCAVERLRECCQWHPLSVLWVAIIENILATFPQCWHIPYNPLYVGSQKI